MVPVHNPVNKPTTQCTYHHIQYTLQQPLHLQCTHYSSHCIFSAHTTAAIASSVHTLQQPLHLQCTHYSSHCIFSAHTTAAIASSVHTLQQPLHLQCTLQPCTAMYSYLQPIFSAHCSQLQPSTTTYTTAIPFSAHCSYTI